MPVDRGKKHRMAPFLLFYVGAMAWQPIGYSRDENGRPCATYEIKKDTAYETRCDYGGEYPASVSNPLSKQAPSR